MSTNVNSCGYVDVPSVTYRSTVPLLQAAAPDGQNW